MDIVNEKFTVFSRGFDDAIDVTQRIKTIVSNSNAFEGLVTISSTLPTVSFLRFENTKGLITDIKNLLSSFVPVHKVYEHDNNWHDGNAYSHLKAMLMGNSISFVITKGTMELPFECSIVMIDFNNKSGEIPINVTVMFKTAESKKEQ